MINLTILLVDDDRDLAESLADYIALQGHEVDIALTAEEGIAAAGNKDYDAVLVDIGLPDINGVSALYAIKEVKPETRVLLMTGYGSDHVDRVYAPDAPLPVMTKPLDLDVMMAWLTSRVIPFASIGKSPGDKGLGGRAPGFKPNTIEAQIGQQRRYRRPPRRLRMAAFKGLLGFQMKKRPQFRES